MPIPLFKSVVAAGPAFWLLFASASLDAPRLGFVLLGTQEVWSVRGVAGAYYFGQMTATAVDEMTFNGSVGVRTAGTRAELLGANGEVVRAVTLDESGVVRVGLSTIEDAAFVLTRAEVWRITRERADRYPMEAPDGDSAASAATRVVGLSGAGRYLDVATVSEGQVHIRRLWLDTGESMLRETFTGHPERLLFLPGEMLLWAEDGVIHMRRADGSTIQVDTGATRVERLAWAGGNLILASAEQASDGRHFVLHLIRDPNAPQQAALRMLQLPGNPQP